MSFKRNSYDIKSKRIKRTITHIVKIISGQPFQSLKKRMFFWKKNLKVSRNGKQARVLIYWISVRIGMRCPKNRHRLSVKSCSYHTIRKGYKWNWKWRIMPILLLNMGVGTSTRNSIVQTTSVHQITSKLYFHRVLMIYWKRSVNLKGRRLRNSIKRW